MFTYGEEQTIFNNLLLRKHIARLPIKQQAIVALISAGYTQKECGEIVGLTRAAVGFIYKQALRRLQTELTDDQ